MKEVILVSMMSFFVILAGALYTTGYLDIGYPVQQEELNVEKENESLLRVQLLALEKLRDHEERKKLEMLSLENNMTLEKKMIGDQREKLKKDLDDIEEAFRKLSKAREERVTTLSKLYESMKPEEAAKIASSLDLDLLVEIVVKMKARQAAKMMEKLPPVIGAEISKKLGERGVK